MVKQEWAAVEMCSIEAKNRYRVSQPNGDSEGTPFMYVTEKSGCMERVCCSVNRSLTLELHQGPAKEFPIIQTMEKPCHWQGCCFMRPKFDVFKDEAKNEPVGTVEDPFKCCCMDQQVKVGGNTVFTTYGSACQAGMFCPCICPITFDVMRPPSQEPVAHVIKMPLDCMEMCVKTNRFKIQFEKIKDATERRMLFAAAMLLDLEYFEQNK